MTTAAKPNEVDAILEEIETGARLLTLNEIDGELRKVIKLLDEEGAHERAERLRWDWIACFLHPRTFIVHPPEDRTNERYSLWFELPEGFVSYIAKRADEIGNDVLKARYFDFAGEKSPGPDRHKYVSASIGSYLICARRFAQIGKVSHAIAMADALDHAVFLGVQWNQRDKVAEAADLLIELIERLKDVKPDPTNPEESDLPSGRWVLEPATILLYVRRQPSFAHLVSDTVLARVQQITDDLATTQARDGNIFLTYSFLDLATQAAFLRGDPDMAFDLRIRYGESLEREAERQVTGAKRVSHLNAATFCENAFEYYGRLRDDERTPVDRRAELERRQDRMKLKTREMYRLAREEFKPIAVPIEIPRDEFEEMMAFFLEPDEVEECLQRVAYEASLLPHVESAYALARQIFEGGFLFVTIPRKFISNEMTVKQAFTDDERFRSEVERNLLMQIEINSRLVLPELLKRLRLEKGLNADVLSSYIEKSDLIDPDNLEIIRVGLERYFACDHVSALHILVTQFEDVLRTIFDKAGHPVVRPRRDRSGWQFEPFGTFLERDFVKIAMPRDLHQYVKLVMTETTGWNLRNEIAHGLIRPQQCTQVVADTVVHLFLLITLFRIGESAQLPKVEEVK